MVQPIGFHVHHLSICVVLYPHYDLHVGAEQRREKCGRETRGDVDGAHIPFN